MEREGTALVLNAVWEHANLWSCWGCPFLFKMVNEDEPGGAWVLTRKVYYIDEIQDEEGGRCSFWDLIELGVKKDASQCVGSEELLTPCGISFFGLFKSKSII